MITKPETKIIPGRIEIPEFEFKGVKFPAHPFSYNIENLGTEKRAYELGLDSLTLGYQAALFEIALLTMLDKNTGVSDEVKEAALEHYAIITSKENKGKGNWNRTAFDYDTDFGKPNPWLPEGYERIGVINLSEWKEKGGIWTPEGEINPIDAPPLGFAALTKDGLYQASGYAFETATREEAKRRLKEFALQCGNDESFAKDFAEKNVSYSYRRNKGTRYSPVSRDFYLDDSGPFCVNAGWGADDGAGGLGSFPSRSSDKKE